MRILPARTSYLKRMYTSPGGVVVPVARTTASAMNTSAPPKRQPTFANASTGPTTVKNNHRRHMATPLVVSSGVQTDENGYRQAKPRYSSSRRPRRRKRARVVPWTDATSFQFGLNSVTKPTSRAKVKQRSLQDRNLVQLFAYAARRVRCGGAHARDDSGHRSPVSGTTA